MGRLNRTVVLAAAGAPELSPAVCRTTSRARLGRDVVSFVAPSHPLGRVLAWSAEIDRLGAAAAKPVLSTIRDDLGRSKPAASVAPFKIRHGPLLASL